MKREKSNILSRRPESIIFMLLIGLVSVLLNFTFSHNSFAEYKATLSASVNEDTAAIDGTEVIESSSETAEHAINLKVKTTNKTGYTATISSKTDETALLNTNPAITTKISSISSVSSLSNLPANTWGYSFNADTNFNPIPALSAPANLIHTTEKSTSEENHTIKLGMKLNSNLKPGNYENKLIISVVSNSYTPKAVMTEGLIFNSKLKSLETSTDKIEHFKKSPTPPATTTNVLSAEDEDSDYEIKLWLDPADKTAYYYAEPEKVYLNENSRYMFFHGWNDNLLANILDIDVSNFNTSNVTNMYSMFSGMSKITSLDVSNFDTSKVTNMSHMFNSMHNLSSLNLSNFDTSNVKEMYNMFYDMFNLNTLNLSDFNTSKVIDMRQMFSGVRSLTSLDVSNFDTSKVTDMSNMFSGMRSLTHLDVSNFDTSKVTDMSNMFSGMHNLTSLNLSNFDTSKVTDMSGMFLTISSLTTLDVSNFDTSKVTRMNGMFAGMAGLTSLNVSNFNTSNVTNMQSMFSNLRSLTTLDVSNFDTSNVTNMRNMFSSIYNLVSLDLSNFNTSKVVNMGFMFSNSYSLTSLNLSNFDTSNVTDMESMFSGMYNLISLDLSNFNTSKVMVMSNMFSITITTDPSKDRLEKIYVNNDFDTSSAGVSATNMFSDRRKLRGGAGSFLTDPSTADKTWLRIDDPAHGRPGYFTRKP